MKILYTSKGIENNDNVESVTLNRNNEIKFSTASNEEIILHWGLFIKTKPHEWIHPPKENLPKNTKEFDKNALQTHFTKMENVDNNEQSIYISLPSIPNSSDPKTIYGGIKYVFYLPKCNRWYNNNSRDYMLKFYYPLIQKNISNNFDIPDYVADIIDCEVNYSQWTLSHRYNKVYDILNQIDNSNYQWVLVYLRYSYSRLLTWQRNTNTPPRVLSGALSRLTHHLSGLYISNYKNENNYKDLSHSPSSIIKMTIALLGKGTGNGQAIRDDILRIMHKHNLPRKGLYFYEQWHQKLHNNSTPDDIVICEALLAFLRSKNIEDYRRVLQEGGITKERLASYERNITTEPEHNYNYIGDFENFLNILKSVHSNNDLVTMYNSAKYIINNQCYIFDDIIKNKSCTDQNESISQIGKVVNGRKIVSEMLNNICLNENDNNKVRDLIFFDISLEDYLRQLIEKIIHINLSFDTYIHLITLMIENVKYSFPHYIEINLIWIDWNEIVVKHIKDFSYNNMLKVKSVYNRLMILLNKITDFFTLQIQPKAKYLGTEFNIDKEHIEIFSEELIRGTIFFCLSMLLRKIEKIIREKTSNSNWLIISRGIRKEVRGKAKYYHNMGDAQFEKFESTTILIVNNVKGEEEVPEGCGGLIIINDAGNYPDVLSHISVRTRNMKIIFGVCFDEEKKQKIKSLDGKIVKLSIIGAEINVEESNEINDKIQEDDKEKEKKVQEEIISSMKKRETFQNICIELKDYDLKYVGAKSLNSQKLYNNVPNIPWLKYPESFSIPFGTMNKFLSLEDNKSILQKLNSFYESLYDKSISNNKDKITEILLSIKKQILSLTFPKNSQLTTELNLRLLKCGISKEKLEKAYYSIKSVWSSISNLRVYLSLSKYSIPITEVNMSVLVQKIIPSEYAFVIHTKNPMNNNADELLGEVINGMGEGLVGAYEGQGFYFIYNKKSKNYQITSYQNKSIKLINGGDFIFRSDSNIEDIENFSGAGLFDSIPMEKDIEVDMSYKDDKLFTDESFTKKIMEGISAIGSNIEQLYKNVPQDIEGVFSNGEFYVVQTRPQV